MRGVLTPERLSTTQTASTLRMCGEQRLAQAGAFADQKVHPVSPPPLNAGVDIGDEEMIRAQGPGQAGFDRNTGLLVALLVIPGQTVELDYP